MSFVQCTGSVKGRRCLRKGTVVKFQKPGGIINERCSAHKDQDSPFKLSDPGSSPFPRPMASLISHTVAENGKHASKPGESKKVVARRLKTPFAAEKTTADTQDMDDNTDLLTFERRYLTRNATHEIQIFGKSSVVARGRQLKASAASKLAVRNLLTQPNNSSSKSSTLTLAQAIATSIERLNIHDADMTHLADTTAGLQTSMREFGERLANLEGAQHVELKSVTQRTEDRVSKLERSTEERI